MRQPFANADRGATASKFPKYSVGTLLRTMAVLALAYILLLAYLHYKSEAEVRRIFGGSAGLSALRQPDRVEAYRLGKLAEKFGVDWADAGLSDYPILKGPVIVPAPDSQTLSLALQDRNSYHWDATKACIPRPGVRFDFIRGDDRLSVLVCLECDIILNFLDDKFVDGADPDYMRPTLVRIAHSLFPDDPQIQSLTEQH